MNLKLTNGKQYWKTPNMIIKSDRTAHDIPSLRDLGKNYKEWKI